MLKKDTHQFIGMQQDIKNPEVNAKFIYEGKNIRMTSQGENSLMHITNEKGNTLKNNKIKGIYLGHAIIGKYLIIFTKYVSTNTKITNYVNRQSNLVTGIDYIYRIDLDKLSDQNYSGEILHYGDLNFSLDHPIETLSSYENEYVQKVYWTDGLNQPRVINVVKENPIYNNTSFDFSQNLKLAETVTISKQEDSSGSFNSGVIQYALSYYNKYSQESNIFYISPIHSILPLINGASADTNVPCSFAINIKDTDSNFEYVRVYSIHRTSLDSTPSVKIVTDIDLSISNSNTSTVNLYNRMKYYHKERLCRLEGTGWNNNSILIYSSEGELFQYSLSDIYNSYIEYEQNKYNYTINDHILGYLVKNCIYRCDTGDTVSKGNFDRHKEVILILKTEKLEIENNNYYIYVTGTGKHNLATVGDKPIYVSLDQDYYWMAEGNLNYPIIGGFNKSIELDNKPIISEEDLWDDSSYWYVGSNFGKGNIEEGYTIYDNGTTGSYIDPTMLMYLGGEEICAKTMTQKDGTLFLGNIEIKRHSVPEDITAEISGNTQILDFNSINDATNSKLELYMYPIETDFNYRDTNYPIPLNDNSEYYARFKSGEYYRLGIQFQHKTGKWSEPIFVRDILTPEKGSYRPSVIIKNNKYNINQWAIKYKLDKTNNKKLLDLGYLKVRPVVVFPELKDRRVIAQGIVCPTVFKSGLRKENAPYSQSSWFLRPGLMKENAGNIRETIEKNGNLLGASMVEFRHNCRVIAGNHGGAEIQNIYTGANYSADSTQGDNPYPNFNTTEKTYNITETPTTQIFIDNYYYIDKSIFELYSPDLEFLEEYKNFTFTKDIELRIVGTVPFSNTFSDIKVSTSSVVFNTNNQGFIESFTTSKSGRGISTIAGYNDDILDDYEEEGGTLKVKSWSGISAFYGNNKHDVRWLLYPWQRSGSLNNDYSRLGASSVLKEKVISNIRYSNNTRWFTTAWNTGEVYSPEHSTNSWHKVNYTTSVPALVHSEEINILKVNLNKYYKTTTVNTTTTSLKDNYINYYSNVDQIADPYKEYPLAYLAYKGVQGENGNFNTYYKTPTINDKKDYVIGNNTTAFMECMDPVRIKYKTSPHIVMGFTPTVYESSKYIDVYHPILPSVNDNTEDIIITSSYNSFPNWLDSELKNKIYSFRTIQPNIKVSDQDLDSGEEYLFIAELYRKNVPTNLFNGNSKLAIEQNIWIPAGEPEIIKEQEDTLVTYKYGDTWYQRYDCLKTYPFTNEDVNQVVEIGSFLCENRVNLDGRYDNNNRGGSSFLSVSKANFNLWNSVYAQKDNFFRYRRLNEDYYKLNKFPNTVTWTLEKHPGSETDPWTNVTVANTLNMRGECGNVNYLGVFGNTLYCVQDRGFSEILFNSRSAISTQDGVPIELGSSYNVSGYRYHSDDVGTKNKWSIVQTSNGVYFFDDNTKNIFLYSDRVKNISSECNMRSFFKKINDDVPWRPLYTDKSASIIDRQLLNTVHFNNFKASYDSMYSRVYFINGSTGICFNEELQQFESFVDYENTFSIFNVGGKVYSLYFETDSQIIDEFKYDPESKRWKKVTLNSINIDTFKTTIWQNYTRNDTNIYGNPKDYSIVLVSNADNSYDKIFNTVEFNADILDSNNKIPYIESKAYNKCPFKKIRVWNEYQDTGSVNLEYNKGNSNLKQKFRTWRIQIPRDQKNGRDRIRNPWTYVKLSGNLENSDNRMELNMLEISYFAQ